MNTKKRTPTHVLSVAAGLIAAALLAGPTSAQTLTVSSLQGSTNGSLSVFSPGDTVTAIVTLQNGSFPLSQAWIVAQVPIGANLISTVMDASDLQGTFTLPANVPMGSYAFTAYATDSQGNAFQSAPLPFAVEAYANSYQILPNVVNLRYVGDQSSISVSGLLPNGTTVDMTYATTTVLGANFNDFFAPVTYTSLNSKIASVDNYGTVTGTGAGITCIGAIVSYLLPPSNPNSGPGQIGELTIWITVTVPSTIRGDLNGDGRVDLLDLQILEERLNSSALTSVNLGNPVNFGNPIALVDARDLNGDGVINALDARVLVTLCTQSGCVVK